MTATSTAPIEFMASLVTESGPFWGDIATPDQFNDAIAVLDPQAPVRRFWMGRGRGYSKTTDVAAMTLAAMACGIIPAGGRGYVFAADGDQAALLIDAARGFISRTPNLAPVFIVDRRRITGPNNTEVQVITSDAASAYGLRGHWFVIDELCQWPDTPSSHDLYDAITTAWPKVAMSRAIIITTAGSPSHFARQEYEHALTSDLWRVSDLHGPPPWLDPDQLADEKARLPESVWRRMWLNEWAEPEDRLVRAEDLAACTRTDPNPLPYDRDHGHYLITVDIGLKRDRTAVVTSHRDKDTDGRPVVIDQIRTWQGTPSQPVSLTEVQAHIAWLSKGHGDARVLIDPYQAAMVIEVLRARHIKVDEFTFTPASNSELAASLYQAIRDRTITLPDQAELATELLNLQLHETSPGVWKMDHRSGRHDDQAVTVAMATWWHTTKNNRKPYIFVGPISITKDPERFSDGAW